MSKPKFNKTKCLKCKYHVERGSIGYPVNVPGSGTKVVHCNYATITNDTCLRLTEKGVEDMRGEDYNHCKLFEKGEALEEVL